MVVVVRYETKQVWLAVHWLAGRRVLAVLPGTEPVVIASSLDGWVQSTGYHPAWWDTVGKARSGDPGQEGSLGRRREHRVGGLEVSPRPAGQLCHGPIRFGWSQSQGRKGKRGRSIRNPW